MYVLKRIDQGGGYVNRPGSHHSYTRSLEACQKYATREDAERARCVENEIVIDLDELLR